MQRHKAATAQKQNTSRPSDLQVADGSADDTNKTFRLLWVEIAVLERIVYKNSHQHRNYGAFKIIKKVRASMTHRIN